MPKLAIFAALASAVLSISAARADIDAFRSYSGEAGPVDNSAYADFLEKYVEPDATGIHLVAYAAVTDPDKAALDGYVASLEALDPTRLTRDEAFAYWANLYNAVTLKLILDNYPLGSIRELKSGLISIGPWGRDLAEVNGVVLTLNDIEHEILRAFWDEPRVHYAVNCASMGCPNLMAKPWTGASLDNDLNAAARAFVNHPRGVSVENGRVSASTIYKWFRKDFGGSEAEVLDHIRQYADDDLKAALDGLTSIRSYDYDWSLNEVKR
ncbi:MAG: DUF547 domain-containing protein [Pseudomonadota bacterium]